jgi:hypothetical protein
MPEIDLRFSQLVMKQLMFQRMTVRFVECTGGKVIPREEFLGFVRASETTGEYLAELF